jgi:hypothetical protein
MSEVVKEVFEKHGLTQPCRICRDNHVPATLFQERRCKVNSKKACDCCNKCREVCDG